MCTVYNSSGAAVGGGVSVVTGSVAWIIIEVPKNMQVRISRLHAKINF